jgi:selenocysteine lyase/cysteine desulfurase
VHILSRRAMGRARVSVYVRRELTQLLEPTVAGWFDDANQLDFRVRELTFRNDARRFEMGASALAGVCLATANLDVAEEIGVDRIHARKDRIHARKVTRAREKLVARGRNPAHATPWSRRFPERRGSGWRELRR